MGILARKLMDKPASSLTLAYRAVAESFAATITIPASAQEGDLAVLLDRASNNSGQGFPTSVTPSGWTLLRGLTAGDRRRSILSARILGSNPGGTSVTGMDGSSSDCKIMYVFSTGGATSFSFSPDPFNGESTDLDPAAQTVLSGSGSVPLVVIGANSSSGSAGNLTGSSTFDGTYADTGENGIMGYKIYNSSPSNFTVDASDTGTNMMLMSGYITVL